jgi:hypothetical protein
MDSFASDPHAPAPVVYYDRSVGLTIFGILTIGLGLMCGLLVGVMLLGQSLVSSRADALPFSTILPGISMYVVLAIALVWLGIGSIQARRWARALLLIFSWSWLIVGIIAIASAAFILPGAMASAADNAAQQAGRPSPSGAALAGVMVFIFAFYGVIFIALPGAWVFFYSSRHVRGTCEWRDPVPRWTDACPLPVLAICLWALLTVPMLLIMPLTGHVVVPFFGMLLTGPPAATVYLLLAGLWVMASGLMYQLDTRGWWLVLVALLLGTVSTAITYTHHDILEMYRLMGFPEAQIAEIQKTGIFAGNRLLWSSFLFAVPFFGYLFFVKRYFRKR